MIPMMQFAGVAQGGAAIVTACSFSGTFNSTGAGPTVTSSTRTVTVPNGNSGEVHIRNQVESGTVAFEYSKNGGAFASAEANPTSITFANGDTLALRITGATSGEGETFDIYDVSTTTNIVTNVTIEVP